MLQRTLDALPGAVYHRRNLRVGGHSLMIFTRIVAIVLFLGSTLAAADELELPPLLTPVASPDLSVFDDLLSPPANELTEALPLPEEELAAASEPVKSHPDLWTHLRAGFSLPDLDDPLVAKHEAWYAARPDYVARMVERSQRYLYFVVAEVEKRGMPLEVALLPMIESAFNPMALSRSRASGLWQFIPSTGRHYGLQQNWWYDERRDVVAATNGALDYLQMLHGMFGDWQLAFAAYNWGEGAVTRAVAANQKHHRPTDYQSLKMPSETRNYLPKLQAVKNIIMRPEAFGLELASIPDTPYFATVQVPSDIDMKLAAELAEMPLEEFVSLNPAHNRPVIAGGQAHTVLLPFDKAELFSAKLALTNQPLVSWRAYKLRPSDRIETLAARCGLSVEALKAVNGVSGRRRIPTGYTLLMPMSDGVASSEGSLRNAVFTPLPAERAALHRVQRGETMLSIASDFGVTQRQLRAWNGLHGDTLSPGMRLRVSEVVGGSGKSGKRTASAKTKSTRTKAPVKKKHKVG
jgi:membrane-bound lytic murein transglycosylase D